MTQAHEVLASMAAVATGAVLGLAAIVALMRARGQRLPGRATAPGLVPQAYRYCPAEQRTRAATPHPDGTATCADCGTHIPAADTTKGGHL